MTFTKERLEQYAYDKRMCNINDEIREMARMALAGMEAEPVAYMTYKGYLLHADDPKVAEYSEPMPLYDAPQPLTTSERAELENYRNAQPVALVEQSDFITTAQIVGEEPRTRAVRELFEGALIAGQKLYAVPQPAPVVPEELLSAMEEVLRISDRDHDAWHKVRDGIASCRAAILQTGNSPVTPDGWVIVPKEMTPEMMRAVQIKSELGGYAASELSGAYDMFAEFWDVAVSAAPKQEVK